MPGADRIRLSLLAAVTMLALVVAGAALGPPARPAAAADNCTVDATLDAEEQTFFTLINNHRQANGLPKLQISYMLTRASAWKSQDMANNNYFAHDDLSRTWVARVRDCGYGFNTYLGENIAAGVQTGQQAFDIWKNSPGHNANMLGANYTAIGIGRAYRAGSPYGWYWTTNFGGFDDGWSSAIGAPPASIETPAPPAAPATDAAPAPSTPPENGRGSGGRGGHRSRDRWRRR